MRVIIMGENRKKSIGGTTNREWWPNQLISYSASTLFEIQPTRQGI